jgi:soluble lytic murein transglycosylase-like protein
VSAPVGRMPLNGRSRGSAGCLTPVLLLVGVVIVGWFVLHSGALTLPKSLANVQKSMSTQMSLFTSPASPSYQSLPIPQTKYPSYVEVARQAALDNQIEPSVFIRQINQKSGFNPDVTGASGEIGIAQFMPETARSLGINAHDPVAALKGAARFMASYVHHFGGDYEKALAAYNAGAGTVESAIAQGGTNWKAYIPASTRRYVAIILNEGA